MSQSTSARENSLSVRLNDYEMEYIEELQDRLGGVSKSEVIRILLFDSRFLYSEKVDLGDINVPVEDLIDDEDADTTIKEALSRIDARSQ